VNYAEDFHPVTMSKVVDRKRKSPQMNSSKLAIDPRPGLGVCRSFSHCLVHCLEESAYQASVVVLLSIKAGFPIDVGECFGTENRS
jgi:hypothetical protein